LYFISYYSIIYAYKQILIILSDIDGLYDKDPHSGEDCKLIPVIRKVTSEIDKIAGGAGTKRGTGGMATKISAARIATSAGVHMVIANGSDPEVIMKVVSGEDVGSLFLAKGDI
jgi:glutamate 5-kinase